MTICDRNWDFDSVNFKPIEISEVDTRDKCDTSVEAFGMKFSMPLITAPMDSVCNGEMAAALAQSQMLGIIHCKQDIIAQQKAFLAASLLFLQQNVRDYKPTTVPVPIACAVGVVGDSLERFVALVKEGCRIFCLDTANGSSTLVSSAVQKMYHEYPNLTNDRIYFIAGNVASKEGYQFLSRMRFDAVRVGIAGGHACTTRTETGVHAPTLYSVNECAQAKAKMKQGEGALIIADGGIRSPADMNKCLAMGADLVMAGYVFAGCDEAPGEIEHDEHGVAYKMFRGSASFATQLSVTGRRPKYVEGQEMKVKYTGPVKEVIDRFQSGLKSAMSYHNSLDLATFKAKAKKSLLFT